MQITAIAPWFGAKRNMAKRIVAELGSHRSYWEPFCGSMAVLLAKQPSKSEAVSDLHGDLTNLARVMADPMLGPLLYRRCRRTPFCEGIFDDAKAALPDTYTSDVADPDRAYNYFVLAWMGRNGMAGTARSNHHLCARYTSNGGDPAKRWRSASYAIASIGKRLRNVTILRRDAFELLPRIEDKAGTVIYVDPPYINKGAEYIHDLASGDHKRLADILGRFQQTRVVVSYYDHPELDRLYPDFTQVKIEVTKALANQGQREAKKTKATEVLLINGPSYTESKALF